MAEIGEKLIAPALLRVEFHNLFAQAPIERQHILVDMDSGFDLATTESLADGQNLLFVVLVDMYQFAHSYYSSVSPQRYCFF